MKWFQSEVFSEISNSSNRMFLVTDSKSRMARNVFLFVHRREFQYQAQISKCILSI